MVSWVQPLGEARLLVSKFLLSSYAVEGKDLIVEYRLYNVGDKPALRVGLDDRHNFPTNFFDIERGLLQVPSLIAFAWRSELECGLAE